MNNIPSKKTPGKAIARTRKVKKHGCRANVTKKARLISLLSKDRGADVGGLSKRLGWLPHTTRAALSGLRKSGYVITSAKLGSCKLRRYHITSSPAGQDA